MKKLYITPKAELICFVPSERLASWERDDTKTWTFFNHWGSLGTQSNKSTKDVSGVLNWYDDSTKKKIYDLDD